MDILCPVCAEPWDNESLHDVVAEGAYPDYATAAREFRSKGCEVFNCSHALFDPLDAESYVFKVFATQAIYEILGDDMDGAAAAFQDYVVNKDHIQL